MLKKQVVVILLLLPIFLLAEKDIKKTDISIYNDNLGLVQQLIDVRITKGNSLFKIDGVSAGVDPTSVHLSFPKSKIKVLEQNYLYDLVNSGKIFEKYIGETITCYTRTGNVFSAQLLSIEGNNLIVRKKEGGIRIINRKEIFDYNFPKLPGGLILKPTLQWQLTSNFSGKTSAKLSYLTSGMSWHAEYILILDNKDEKGTLSSWVSLQNRSGASFREVKLKLIAGEINRARKKEYYPRMEKKLYAVSMLQEDAGNFEERGLMDYHLYELQRPVDLKDKEIKQVAMFDDLSCKVDKQYLFSNNSYASISKALTVKVNIANTKKNNLGIPLPKGVVRIFKKDIDATLQLVGEDNTNHISKNDTLRLTVGKAFDVKGERIITNRRQQKRSEEISVKIKVTNNKNERIPVIIEELHSNDWTVLQASEKYVKKSNTKLHFYINIDANSSKSVEYTFRRNW